MLQDLYTLSGEQLQGTPWQEYPRPQMKRDSYVNLNGWWEFTAAWEMPTHYDKKIQVPFCPESLLSGIHQHFEEGIGLYYRRSFSLPENFNGGRVLLHIGAADQKAEVYVNHKRVGSHCGGYTAFTLDITEALQDENELVICCTDDLTSTRLPYGKQTLNRGGMWYTPVSGIWQSVWLESVPRDYIQTLKIENRGSVVTVSIEPKLEGCVNFEGKSYPLESGAVTITPENPRFWSPEDPYLYTFAVKTKEDTVDSYFALRTLEIKKVAGIPRLCLNGKPYFFHGLLDQGYWPDGIYTPATPDEYTKDILAVKELGFNMLRKHIKVEPEWFYYQCDKLGMVVFQDMVNNGKYSFFRDTALPTVGIQKWDDRKFHPDAETRREFLQTMAATVSQLRNHPSIVYWTIFNEGWGQFDADAVYAELRQLDDTRFIDSTSGWFRRNCTDVESLHIYFGSWSKVKKYDKPLVLSEFGGYAYPVEGHLFNPDKAYGYKSCKSLEEFQRDLKKLYEEKVIPSVKKGLCAAVYTQVSDVEDEINGLLTYDRKVCKAKQSDMEEIARKLTEAVKE